MSIDADLLEDSRKGRLPFAVPDSRADMQKELQRYMDRNVCCLNRKRGCIVKRLRSLSEHPTIVRVLVLLFELTLSLMTFNVVHLHEVFHILIVSHMVLYLVVCFMPPGYVNSTHANLESQMMSPNSTVTFCARCNRSRPARSHHCSVCQRCVLMMDHHCDLTQNCCGERNLIYYLAYEILTCVLSSIGAVALVWSILTRFYLPHPHQALIAAVLQIIVALGSGYLVFLHLFLIFCDMTMMEWFAANETQSVSETASKTIQRRWARFRQLFHRSARSRNYASVV